MNIIFNYKLSFPLPKLIFAVYYMMSEIVQKMECVSSIPEGSQNIGVKFFL